MTLTGDDLLHHRQAAANLRVGVRGEHGHLSMGNQDAWRLADQIDALVAEVEGLRAELDLLGAGCATVIRCGETYRLIGPDGRGVFATINARMQDAPPDRLAGRTNARVIRQQGDELLLTDGERAVRVPISTALDALFPIAEALDKGVSNADR